MSILFSTDTAYERALYKSYQISAEYWYNLYNEKGIEVMCIGFTENWNQRVASRAMGSHASKAKFDIRRFILEDKDSPLTTEDKAYFAMVEL